MNAYDVAIERWLKEDYPQIAKEAKQEKAQVRTPVLAARLRVLLARRINGPGMDAGFLAAASLVSAFRSKPAGPFLFHLSACFCVSLQKFQT
ncbi:hypothetical protein R69658_07622 [Paraburkholderia aspalathi]|uniref:Uncharacterized protein n=1 Tax=Paraburkholderia aspalathi TaxID=1324617 RepID=A0ABM8T662_9BURK|nr:hypothetical protein R69658_07622 [Paraburkholderia aspalathi]